MKLTEEQKYHYAKSKVEKLKSFYIHLMVYMIVNILIISFKVIRNMDNGETFYDALFDASTNLTWMLWGVFIVIHAFKVFGLDQLLGKDWEAKKIQRYMEENKHNQNY